MAALLSAGIWFLVFCGLTFVLHQVYGPILRKKAVKLLFLPGLAALLMFKMLSCYMVGAKIQDTRLLDDDKEIIKYGDPKIGWPGRMVIAVVPFVCLLLLFCILNAAFGEPAVVPDPLPQFSLLIERPLAFFETLLDFILWFFTGILPRRGGGAGLWIMIAVGLNVIIALAPTVHDFKYVALAAGLALLAALCFRALGLGVTGRTDANSFIYTYVEKLNINVKFLLGLGLIWLAASATTVGAFRLYASAAERNKKKGDK